LQSTTPETRLATEADFSIIRYAQCWEDADVLLNALDIQPGDVCLSIASAGDNTLSMLTREPSRVVAIDLSRAQLACLEIRVAAYRTLTHAELLELIGTRPSPRRAALYQRLRPQLSEESRSVWDAKPRDIAAGIGKAGKFEHYLDLFRRFILPLTENRANRDALFAQKTKAERQEFYRRAWNNPRWRMLCRMFMSRTVMGRLGRDPRFFKYAEGPVAQGILERTEHALTELDPRENPYLHWMVFGAFGEALPHALREENFARIRDRLDRLEWKRTDLQTYLDTTDLEFIDRFNLSDLFEYQSEEETERLMSDIVRLGRRGGRIAYWNMMVPRQRPELLADRLQPLADVAARGHHDDRVFFYNAFIVEEIL
jgi:S-adenosylmethionine-diacylglycerol 3-amino-3-carboxypropyl transferase